MLTLENTSDTMKVFARCPRTASMSVFANCYFTHKGALETTEMKKQRDITVEFLCRINFSGGAQKNVIIKIYGLFGFCYVFLLYLYLCKASAWKLTTRFE